MAEEITFGKENITSGASSDIQQGDQARKAMVTQFGYSDELGTVAYGDNQEEVSWACRWAAAERFGSHRAEDRFRSAPACR